MKSISTFAVVALLAIALTYAAEPVEKSKDEFVRPYPIVAIAPSATAAQKAAAKEIAEAVGVEGVLLAEQNPVCCIWIEVTSWTPNPGDPGYFIINQSGGSIISASNEEQLKKATEQFKKSVREGAQGLEVPVGMMTSYRIVAAPVAGK